jgi:mono/diheme cytochrome c family protein
MTPSKPIIQRIALVFFTFLVFSIANVNAQDGKALFMSKCATCHAGDMKSNSTGPALGGVQDRWEDQGKLHEWIRDNAALIKSGYPKAIEVSKISATAMDQFTTLTDADIDAILNYVNEKFTEVKVPENGGGGGSNGGNNNQNAVIFGVISLILALIAFILMYVNSNLKKLSDDTEGIERPEPSPFYRNKVYIAIFSVLMFVV